MAGTGEIKYLGWTKTITAALQFDIGLSGARGRKLSKITWSSSLELMQQASPLLIGKRELLKSP
jgi:hypothetical protein